MLPDCNACTRDIGHEVGQISWAADLRELPPRKAELPDGCAECREAKSRDDHLRDVSAQSAQRFGQRRKVPTTCAAFPALARSVRPTCAAFR